MLLSKRALEGLVEYREVSARLMWVKVKFRGEICVFVSAYGPGSERSEEERVRIFGVSYHGVLRKGKLKLRKKKG